MISALHEQAARRDELPDPLPEPPPIPYAYLQRLGAAIHGPAELSPQTQMTMVFELRGALGEEGDDTCATTSATSCARCVPAKR